MYVPETFDEFCSFLYYDGDSIRNETKTLAAEDIRELVERKINEKVFTLDVKKELGLRFIVAERDRLNIKLIAFKENRVPSINICTFKPTISHTNHCRHWGPKFSLKKIKTEEDIMDQNILEYVKDRLV